VAQNGESEIIRYFFLRSFNFCRFEFKDPSATSADQMIVVLVFDLVASDSIVKMTFLGKTRIHEELQRAINGGVADMGIALANALVEVLARHVPARFEESIKDRLALFRMLEAVRLKESRECLLFELVRHWAQSSRIGPLDAQEAWGNL
jgi:hypothetical protein